LSHWKDKAEEKQAGTTLSENERSEQKRLRKENKELRMEKEILKKASAFFAKEIK
jgi:transposase